MEPLPFVRKDWRYSIVHKLSFALKIVFGPALPLVQALDLVIVVSAVLPVELRIPALRKSFSHSNNAAKAGHRAVKKLTVTTVTCNPFWSQRGLKTPKNALSALVRYSLGSLADPSVLATPPARFELATRCLEGSCSIQLS